MSDLQHAAPAGQTPSTINAMLQQLAANVRRLREELGLTIEDVAPVLELHPREYERLERGEHDPVDLALLARLGRALGVDPGELLVAAP